MENKKKYIAINLFGGKPVEVFKIDDETYYYQVKHLECKYCLLKKTHLKESEINYYHLFSYVSIDNVIYERIYTTSIEWVYNQSLNIKQQTIFDYI